MGPQRLNPEPECSCWGPVPRLGWGQLGVRSSAQSHELGTHPMPVEGPGVLGARFEGSSASNAGRTDKPGHRAQVKGPLQDRARRVALPGDVTGAGQRCPFCRASGPQGDLGSSTAQQRSCLLATQLLPLAVTENEET